MQYRKTKWSNRVVFFFWSMEGLGKHIYDMSLVEIGSLFASQMEGPNFQKIISKKSGEELWLEMRCKRCAFYLPFRIYNFYDVCRGGTVSKM